MATKSSRLAIILGLNDRGFNAGLTKASARFKKFGQSMQAAGRNLTTSVSGPLALLSGAAGKAALDFEFAMAKVKAVAGASAEDMKKLEDSAKQLGATTAFSASEVATLQLELSKLGFAENVDDIINMEGGILALAQAFDNELGATAEVVGNTMRQFGIDASDAGRVADVMAVAFGNSALDLERFSGAMANVGPIASDAGLNLEETTALLGILANNGISGADAGTKLKMALTNIRAAGLDVDDTLRKVIEGGYNFEDSLELLGKRAQIVAPILGSAGDKSAELADKLRMSSGAAQAAQGELDNTTKGALFRMRSALEGLAISFGELLLPRIERMADIVGSLAARFQALDGPTKELILNVVGVASALGPALILLGKLSGVAGTLIRVLGVLAGPWGLVAAAVVAAVYLIYENWDALVRFFTEGEGTGFLDAVINAFNAAATLIVDIVEFIVAGALAFWDTFGADLTRLAVTALESLVGLFQRAFEGVARLFGAFSKLFNGDWRGFFEGIVDTAITILQFLLERFIIVFGTIGGIIDSIANALGFDGVDTESFIRDLGASLVDGLEGLKFEETGATQAEDYFTGFSSALGGFFSGGFSLPSLGGAPSGSATGGPQVSDLLKSLEDGGLGRAGGGGFLEGEDGETVDKLSTMEAAFASLGQAGRQALDGIGNAFADVVLGTRSFGDAIRAIGQQLIRNLINIAVGYAITAALSPFAPENLATAGASGTAKAGAAPGLVSAFFSGLTAFADGGAVLGPTLALIGENPASRGEFVIPFERVGSFVNQFQSQTPPVVVNGRISGNDIHLTNFESDRIFSRRRVI